MLLWTMYSFTRIQLQQPSEPPIAVIRGNQALLAGDFSTADSQFALAAQTKSPEVYMAILTFCQSSKNWTLLLKYAEKATANLPKSPPSIRVSFLLAAATAYLNTGEPAKCLERSEVALRLDPDNPDALNGLGYIYAEIYDSEKPDERTHLLDAVKLIDSALIKARDTGYNNRAMGIIVDSQGWLQYKLKNYKEAVSCLERAAELNPMQAEIEYHLSLAYCKLENYGRSMTAINRALILDPNLKVAIMAHREILSKLIDQAAKSPPGTPSDSLQK